MQPRAQKTVLVVGPETGLRDVPMRGQNWRVETASGLEQVVRRLAYPDPAVDAVVADEDFSFDGTRAFLAQLGDTHPHVGRLGLKNGKRAPLVAPPFHTIKKGADPALIERMLDRTCLVNAAIRDDRVRSIVSRVDRIPSAPRTYFDLVEAAASDTAGLSDLAKIIATDVAMTARVLQLVNSAFFGRGQRIGSIQQAVSRLGVGLIKGLVLTAHVFNVLDPRSTPGFSIERFQDRSLKAARLAQRFVTRFELGDEAFTAGLLHDIGSLVLTVYDPILAGEIRTLVETKGCSPLDAERALFGVTRAQIGACLLAKWGIPFGIVEAVLFHRTPHSKHVEEVEVLAALHAATAFLPEQAGKASQKPKLDACFLSAAGLSSAVVKWRMIAERDLEEP